jgi:hypothetical protein
MISEEDQLGVVNILDHIELFAELGTDFELLKFNK